MASVCHYLQAYNAYTETLIIPLTLYNTPLFLQYTILFGGSHFNVLSHFVLSGFHQTSLKRKKSEWHYKTLFSLWGNSYHHTSLKRKKSEGHYKTLLSLWGNSYHHTSLKRKKSEWHYKTSLSMWGSSFGCHTNTATHKSSHTNMYLWLSHCNQTAALQMLH